MSGIFLFTPAFAQSNVTVRIMAANITSGNGQSYETAGINIFQGLKPDVVAIQEFRYASSSTSNSLRTLVNTAFGTNFSFYCESGYNIPNGIVSRYPIVAAGSLDDPTVNDRGIAWAQIDLPGTNDLYVISVHLYGSGTASDRNTEAMVVTNFIATNCPANAWVVVGGDFNTSSRSEACVTTLKSKLSDLPVPDDNGTTPDQDTNEPRNKPYDYVLPSFALTNLQVPVVIGANTFTNGLVFDSTVFSNNFTLSAVSPVASGDSHVTGMQHMAVIKDFSILATPATNPPVITAQPQGRTNAVGSTISFSVTATGSGTLAYQWLFGGANLSGATMNPLVLTNAQLTNNGNYSVLITNAFGSATSSVAVLFLTNAPPSITSQPQGQTVLAGQSAMFSVSATGTPPLGYQWLFSGTNIFGATTNPFVLANVQSTNAGNYSVIVSNFAGSVTSSAAALTIVITNPTVFAQWNFNSVPSDTNTGTGSLVPSIGSGTASAIGSITASFVGGDTVLDPAPAADNTAWTGTGYPASTANNKTAGVQFAVSTAGKQNLSISYSIRSSNTGGRYFRLQYSTNGGVGFLDSPFVATLTAGAAFFAFTNNLALPGVNDNSNFVFRLVAEFQSTATGSGSAAYIGAGGTYATSGTTRFDMVTVSGTALVSGSAATLAPLTFTNGVFTLGVTGTITASYVVQASTNLSSTNWLPVFTNVSPFSFSESNLLAPQKFYRAVAQ